jgi:hypothetical protein
LVGEAAAAWKDFMRVVKQHFVLFATALLMSGSLVGCGSSSGSGPSGGQGGSSTGGAGGIGGSGGTGGSGGSGGVGTGGAGGSTGGADGAVPDATAGAGGTSTAADGGDDATGTSGSDGGPISSDGGSSTSDASGGTPGAVLACWADPKVIKICHQLENACENCGPKKAVACNTKTMTPPEVCGCFALIDKAFAGMATDEDCAKYAVDNSCTVDNATTTGNICGSLDCSTPACKCTTPGCEDEGSRGKTCAADQHWGDASGCQKWVAKCPCK